MADDETDREIRALLGAADPARGIADPSAPEDWIERLAEDTMSNEPTGPTTTTGQPRRTPWVLAAAAVVLIAAVGFAIGLGGGSDDADQVADPGTSATPSTPAPSTPAPTSPATSPTAPTSSAPSAEPSGAPVVVTVAAVPARCIPATAESTAKLAAVAFEATATEVQDRRATLQITRWYRTDPSARYGDTVVLRSSGRELIQQVGGIEFRQGESYLLAVNDNDQLVLCGHSASVGPQITRMYAQAFPQ